MSDTKNNSARFTVGVDLGTTRCSLAWTDIQQDPSALQADVEVLAVPQVSAPGERISETQLPSYAYFPLDAETQGQALALPGFTELAPVVGRYARDRGALAPGRVAHSAKSWLSHEGVDRHAGILPWGGADDVVKLSPVQISATYLNHLRQAWELTHPEAPLAQQDLVLTVPASFDPVARQLTREAAEQAGFGSDFILLEEPQAAFYAWLDATGNDWRNQVKAGDLVLVVDLGGGTTDFSLIAVSEDDGHLQLERVAVGQHILLGGDNMDLALAYTLKAQLEQSGKTLDDWQLGALTHACRSAKERMLDDESLDSQTLSIPSRGRSLVGANLSVVLERATLEQVVIEGFFPIVDADAKPQVKRRSGLQSLGLPYASDAAISRHLADFLRRHAGSQNSDSGATKPLAQPSAVLFNGGVTRSEAIRERLIELLIDWMADAGAPMPRVLSGTDADLAVARGAAYFAGVRHGRGVRIRGGTARSYYLGIERAEMAVPGLAPRIDAVCIAPFGLEEGAQVQLDETLGLVVGELVSFRFFASSERRADSLGLRIDPQRAALEELPPVETQLDGDASQLVPVRIEAQISALGTLELAAVEQATDRRHRLEFNIRLA